MLLATVPRLKCYVTLSFLTLLNHSDALVVHNVFLIFINFLNCVASAFFLFFILRILLLRIKVHLLMLDVRSVHQSFEQFFVDAILALLFGHVGVVLIEIVLGHGASLAIHRLMPPPQFPLMLNVNHLRVVNADRPIASLCPHYFINQVKGVRGELDVLQLRSWIFGFINELDCVRICVAHCFSHLCELGLFWARGFMLVESGAGNGGRLFGRCRFHRV
jgi:hypothetical protein